jgi:para-nitrobenzyl esterase
MRNDIPAVRQKYFVKCFSCALVVMLLCFGAMFAGSSETGPLAAVTGGKIRGRLLTTGGAVFRGIPFAAPPVGDLRWREPMPVTGWTEVRDVTKSGAPCAQAKQGWNDQYAAAGQEDCLYLDVWAPEWPAKSRKPVMLWIHGGANVAGAGGSDPLYDGTALIGHGVVLVIIEYRLGIFGFFAYPELTKESPHHSSGNYGILDQIAALHWVRDNIAKFGGDPENVTIFGQSAGSMDVITLMASPLAKGLFHRAIGESGAVADHSTASTLAEAQAAGVRAAEKINAPQEGALRYLRSLPTEELLKAPGNQGLAVVNSDGWVLPAAPARIFLSGKEQRVPLILGSNAIEFPAQGSQEELRNAIEARFKDLSPKALALYGLERPGGNEKPDPVYGGLADQWGSDTLRCPAVVQGEWHSAAGNPTWQYQFDRAIPPHPRTGHSGELPYVFGNLYSQGSQAGDFQEADRKLSATMQDYWTNFAKTGNPNGAGLPVWPKYDAKERKYLEFTTAAGVAINENQRGPFCDLFRESLRAAASASETH